MILDSKSTHYSPSTWNPAMNLNLPTFMIPINQTWATLTTVMKTSEGPLRGVRETTPRLTLDSSSVSLKNQDGVDADGTQMMKTFQSSGESQILVKNNTVILQRQLFMSHQLTSYPLCLLSTSTILSAKQEHCQSVNNKWQTQYSITEFSLKQLSHSSFATLSHLKLVLEVDNLPHLILEYQQWVSAWSCSSTTSAGRSL